MYKNYRENYTLIEFDNVISELRKFFKNKGFVEVHTQDRLSILAACEDPGTVQTFVYHNDVWPLPQTGQMWLEYELLQNPQINGVFCLSTSFRNESKPIPGRHETIFPMFEFESKGTFKNLIELETELLEFLDFGDKSIFPHFKYNELSKQYDVQELTSAHETQMLMDYGPVVFLEHFPEYTSPFWNMKRAEGGLANKVDVILYGMETFGSAEREVNPLIMRERFETISNGEYAQLLYNRFGKTRVEKELNEFLSLDFFPRFGAGIGLTRLLRAHKMQQNKNKFAIKDRVLEPSLCCVAK